MFLTNESERKMKKGGRGTDSEMRKDETENWMGE